MASKRKQAESVIDAKTAKQLAEDDAGCMSRTGRIRKKSSKVLEMEENRSDIEQAIQGKLSAANKKKKSEEMTEVPVTSQPLIETTSAKKSKTQSKCLPDASIVKEEKVVKVTTKEYDTEVKEEIQPEHVLKTHKSDSKAKSKKTPPQQEIKEEKKEHESLKFKLHLGATPSVEKIQSPFKPGAINVETIKSEKVSVDEKKANNKNNGSKKDAIKEEPCKANQKVSSVKPKEKISFEAALTSAPLVIAPPKPVKRKKKEISESLKVKDILAAKEKAGDIEQSIKLEPSDHTEVKVEPTEVKVEPTEVKVEPTEQTTSPVKKPKKAVKSKASSLQVSSPIPSDLTSNVKNVTVSPKKRKKKHEKVHSKELSERLPVPSSHTEQISFQNESSMNHSDEDSNPDGLQIVISATPVPKKSTKKSKKESKKSKSADSSGTVYFDTNRKAMQVMTSTEKRQSLKSVKKKSKNAEKKLTLQRKRRRRPGPTAYMLFCNLYRPKVVSENPDRDFSAISKRLGEIWQGLPEKEKLLYKRKAKRAAAKAAKAIVVKNTPPPEPANYKRVNKLIKSYKAMEDPPQFKPPSTEPIDVAAHLKLLGESLSIIGKRLTDHRGQIAVQGSISVLLDSLLCALGPLTALTTQVPELNAITDYTLATTLDNIAFFMPGL